MKTAHEIVQDFMTAHTVTWSEFNEWFHDCGYPEDEANVHDSRFLKHLESFVQERDERNPAS